MILKKPLFLFLFSVILIIGILQQVAVHFYLYWTLSWFDILMHFLGGFWFGYSALWILFFSGYMLVPSRNDVKFFILVAFASAIGVGLLWEVFEYVTGITFVNDVFHDYVFDTIKDLIMDSLGGIVSAIFLYIAYKKRLVQTQQNNVIS